MIGDDWEGLGMDRGGQGKVDIRVGEDFMDAKGVEQRG